MVLPQCLCSFADFALAGQEDQRVARAFAMSVGHRIDDGVVHVTIVVFTEWAIARLDGEQAARNLDHGCALEVLAEALRIERRGSNDDFQIAPLRQELLEEAEQKVDVERTLVRLVDDQCVIAAQERIGLRLGKQDAVGHQLDAGAGGHAIGETNLEADHAAKLGLEFLGDARRGGACGDAARLSVTDQPLRSTPEAEADLRQLGRLARAGLAADDDDLMLADGVRDLLAPGIDRQRLVEFDRERYGPVHGAILRTSTASPRFRNLLTRINWH